MSDDLQGVYERRFGEGGQAAKEAIWVPIVRYLARYMVSGPVVDIACDRGYFIRNVAADERWATDLRDLRAEFPESIRFVQSDGLDLTGVLPTGHFAVAFMSNYLEHLASADQVVAQFRVVRELLRPGGRVIVLQPNIRLIGGAYWDFIDHKVPLTERSLAEAAESAGLLTRTIVPRFLPYTTKSRLPQHPALVRAYLAFPPAWRILGRQTLYVAERPAH